jgi:2-keto-4-pentenoate hydratase
MDEDFDIERAAQGLAAAWPKGLQPAALRPLVRPPTLDTGYAVQDRLVALLGHPVIGWKIGLAGRNGYRGAGLARPLFGRILAPRCFRSGDVVPVPAGIGITVELELVLVMADDIFAQTPVTRDLIQSAHLGFEIVAARLPDRQTIGIAATVADNAVSHAVVLGDAVDFSCFAGIAAQASVTADGRPAAAALSGDDLPDPLPLLGHLAAHLGERGTCLKRGDIVFTGTLTRPLDVTAPAEIVGGAPGPAVRCTLAPSL